MAGVRKKVSVKDVRATPNTGLTDVHVKTFRDSMAKGFAKEVLLTSSAGSKKRAEAERTASHLHPFYYKEGGNGCGLHLSQLRVEIIGELPDGTRLFQNTARDFRREEGGLTYLLEGMGEYFPPIWTRTR